MLVLCSLNDFDLNWGWREAFQVVSFNDLYVLYKVAQGFTDVEAYGMGKHLTIFVSSIDY